MICKRCNENVEKAHHYKFYYGYSEKSQRVKVDGLSQRYDVVRTHVEGSEEGWICKACFRKMIFSDFFIIGSSIFWLVVFLLGLAAVKSVTDFLLLLLIPPFAAVILLWGLGYFSANRLFLQTFIDKQGIRLHKDLERQYSIWTQSEYRELQNKDDQAIIK